MPARVATVYLAFGLLWVWLSDRVVLWVGFEPRAGFWVSAAKGTAFVLLSAGLVYWLVRRSSRDVARTNDLLGAVASSTSDAMFVKDHEGRYLLFNAAAARFVGKAVEDVLGRDDTSLFDPDSARRVMARDRRVMAGGVLETSEEELTAAGVTRTYLATKAPYRDADGKAIGVIGISRDISDQVMAERALKDTQVRLLEAQRLARLGSWFWEPMTGRVWWSDALYELFAVPRDAFSPTAEAYTALVHPEDRGAAGRRIQDLMAGAEVVRDELRIVRADGQTIWVQTHARTTRDAHGRVVRVEGIDQDITARKRAEGDLFASRETLRAVLDGIPQRVFWKANDLTYLGCNRPFAQDMGHRSPADVVGKDDYQSPWAKVADAYRADDRRVLDSGEAKLDYEEELVGAGGRRSWVRTSKQPLRGPDGRVFGVLGTYEDITDRKRAEDVIKASEARQAYLLQLSDALGSVADPVAVQDVTCRTLGEGLGVDRAYYCEVEESAGRIRIARDFVRPGVPSLAGEYPMAAFGWVGPAFRAGRPAAVADVATDPLIPDADRPALVAIRVGAFVAVPLIRGGQIVALLCVTDLCPRAWTPAEVERVVDTAERTWAAVEQARAAVAIRASEARFRTLVDAMPDAVLINAGDRISFCNPSCLRLLGATDLAQVVGRPPLAFVPPAFVDQVRGRLATVRATGRPVSEAEEELLRLDGTTVPVLTSAVPITDGGSDAVVVVFHDLTARKKVEFQLRHQEALLREAAELAHVGGWSFDPVTREGDWTPETARIHGVDPTAPPTVSAGLDRFAGEDRRRMEVAVQAAIEHGTPYDLELDFTAVTGEKKRVRATCRPVVEGSRVVRVRGSLQDVTARYNLEAQFRQAQKMEAFGQLAGGVAHDFNNLLTVINGYTALLLEELPSDDPSRLPLDEVQKAGERSAALTRQLLAFSRQQVPAPRVLDLNTVVGDLAGLIRRLIGEDVRLTTAFARGLWPVLADAGQVEQVLVNLCVNARDAMPTGGRLAVTTRNAVVAAGETADHPDARPGPHAVLTVTDTGCGMPPEVQARIFEPFFTTKGVGKGTGLGLATVFGIVKQAGGHVRVRSAVGAGSTFEVYLPGAAEAAVAPDEAIKPGLRPPAQGRETVLVVEDEDRVRAFVRTVLEGCGYLVLEAADGAAAVATAATHPGPVDLLLTDVVMPGAGGRAAAEQVIVRYPSIRVLYMSGYTDDAVLRHGVAVEGVHFLQKPFTPAALAARVRQILDGSCK
ncbi:PAS domain-containing protein [Limnoglobus roseus]|uniref:PAS domain-containing protein n=1 Tax=Limnoglobus roseus TaxID=2598579 RepID=UPI00143DEADF|nr:PAS domain-containing protein [Limnoglobus roseus]